MRLPGIDWSQVALSGEPDAPSCSLSPERWATPGQKPGGCKGEVRPRPDLWAGFRNPGGEHEERSSTLASAEDCSCDAAAPASRQVAAPTTTVDGEWLARALGLDEASKASVVGQRVQVTERALSALRSAMRARSDATVSRLRTLRSRREIWPDEQRAARLATPGIGLPAGGPVKREVPIPGVDSGLTNPCGCDEARVDLSPFLGYRFVDAIDGDDVVNSGRIELGSGGGADIKPWKTLAAAARWLNSDIYAELGVAPGTCIAGAAVLLAVEQTWDGTEEGADWSGLGSGDAALYIEGFKGASDAPLLISSWDPAKGLESDVPAGGTGPLIKGTRPETENVLYGDERVGLHLKSCCHVTVEKLRVRGFGTGVKVTGASRNIDLTALSLKNHAIFGVYIGVPQADADAVDGDAQDEFDPLDLNTLDATGAYPAYITVSDCSIRSIGYNTAGGDIMLGPLATNCTIASNHLYGDGERGVDGIVSDGGSSGHLIEKNYIYTHNKFCVDDTTGAEVVSEFVTSSVCGGVTLVHPCADRTESPCSLDANGYYLYYDSGGTSGGSEAFGENGIDLKGVRPRTSASRPQTVIRRNRIWGHRWRTGVQIDDGSKEIYIYRNRIFSNGIGIMVTNSKNVYHGGDTRKWWDVTTGEDRATTGVYIYRNLVYLNLERGIVIKGGEDESEAEDVGEIGYDLVREVYVVNNTVAHNGQAGLAVVVDSEDGDDVKTVVVVNNLFARNGILGGDANFGDQGAMQVYWTGGMLPDLGSTGTSVCDYNCYLSWDRTGLNPEENVIRLGSDATTVADVKSTTGLDVEESGAQATALSELYLAGEAGIERVERDGPLADPSAGIGLRDYFVDSSGKFVVDVSDTFIPYSLDYDIADTASLLCTMDSTTAGVKHYRSTRDLSLSPDYKGDSVSDGLSDIGAYEGPAE